MRLSNILILVLVGATGCAGDYGKIVDYRLYDTGEVETVVEVEVDGDWQAGLKNEYFKNGHLKRSEWALHGKPWMIVEFHENGQMKTEERFWGSEFVFGVYYSEDGTLIQQVGAKVKRFAEEDS